MFSRRMPCAFHPTSEESRNPDEIDREQPSAIADQPVSPVASTATTFPPIRARIIRCHRAGLPVRNTDRLRPGGRSISCRRSLSRSRVPRACSRVRSGLRTAGRTARRGGSGSQPGPRPTFSEVGLRRRIRRFDTADGVPVHVHLQRRPTTSLARSHHRQCSSRRGARARGRSAASCRRRDPLSCRLRITLLGTNARSRHEDRRAYLLSTARRRSALLGPRIAPEVRTNATASRRAGLFTLGSGTDRRHHRAAGSLTEKLQRVRRLSPFQVLCC